MNNMLAAVYHGPEDLRVETVPQPETGPGEILVRVDAASICGTDLRILHGAHRKFPSGTVRIPGHEVSGTIVQVGPGLQDYSEGQRVFVAPNWGCGHCRQCISGTNNLCAGYGAIGITQDGAFASYLLIPAPAVTQGNVMSLHPSVDPAQAALIEPLACVLRGQETVGIRPGDVVLVMGAGPIGILHLKLAALSGAGSVIVSEPAQDRLERAIQMGANQTVNPEQQDLAEFIKEATGGVGADVILVATPSHQAQESTLQIAAIGGRINFFGGLPKDQPTIRFDSNQVHYKELVVTGTTACSTRDCWRAAQIVNSGLLDLGSLVSKRFPLSLAGEAFMAAEDRKVLKVVIEP